MHIPDNIGYRINKVRRNKGIKQELVAKALNISQPAYSKKETGDTTVSEEELDIIAQALEVPVEHIMQQTEPTVNQNVNDQHLDSGTSTGTGVMGVMNVNGDNYTFHNHPDISTEDREFLTEAMRTLQKLTAMLEKLAK